ncbi:hypothetical protein MBLNU13_g08469t3 [Cladosporium sp. NU13]
MPGRAASTPPSSPPEAPVRSATAPPVVSTTTTTTTTTAAAAAAQDWELFAARESFFVSQRHYAHDAGVFVGNLPIRLTDLQLLREVKSAFRRYGQCEVMVSRKNGRGTPWAVVQFRFQHEARNAMFDKTRIFIDHRSVRVSRLEDGLMPSMHEMCQLFGHRSLEKISTHVQLPQDPHILGSKVVFRNIGNYNDVRSHMQRHGDIIYDFYRLIAK